jgi:hypothetical protein
MASLFALRSSLFALRSLLFALRSSANFYLVHYKMARHNSVVIYAALLPNVDITDQDNLALKNAAWFGGFKNIRRQSK